MGNRPSKPVCPLILGFVRAAILVVLWIQTFPKLAEGESGQLPGGSKAGRFAVGFAMKIFVAADRVCGPRVGAAAVETPCRYPDLICG